MARLIMFASGFIPNGVDLSVLWCNFGVWFLFPLGSVAGSWLFQFWVLCVSPFDGARLVSAGAIPYKVWCGRMDHPRHIIDRLTFVMECQPGVASRTETDLAGMHFQHRCGVAHQNPHKIITKNGHSDFAVQIVGNQATKFAHLHA